ncbi:MAG: S-layer homology domain-containing protein [Hyphomonadaceae bacterium]|nr:S-layer homology domain-containing protein [Clostridia bacterium]
MKHVKRITVVCMLLCMLFSTQAYALGDSFGDVVLRLSALGIMQGDSKGIRPNDKIKRSEICAMIMRAYGMESVAKNALSNTAFSDVTEKHWASGYVSLAIGLNIVKGFGDGTFHPDDDVTYEQAVKMVVCALGFDPAAQELGGYPTGYTMLAADKGLLQGVVGAGAKPATRGDIARLIDNSLDIPMMIQITNETSKKYVISGASDQYPAQTFSSNKLGMKKYKVIVTKIGDEEVETYTLQSENLSELSSTMTLTLLREKMIASDLENTQAYIWVKDKKIVMFQKDEQAEYDFIGKINGESNPDKTYVTNQIDDIQFKNGSKTYHPDLSKLKIFYNGKIVTSKVALVNRFAKFTMRDNNIVSIVLYGDSSYLLSEGGIITQVDADALQYNMGSTKGKLLSGLSDMNLVVILNGDEMSLTDLKPYMVFDYVKKDDTMIIVATQEHFKGELTSFNEELRRVSIDGESYIREKKSSYVSRDGGIKFNTNEKLINIMGETVSVYTNPQGEVRYLITSSKTFVGVVLSTTNEDEPAVTVLRNEEGLDSEVTYKLDENASGVGFDTLEQKAGTIEGVYQFQLGRSNLIEKIEEIAWLPYDSANNDNVFAAGTVKKLDSKSNKISVVAVNPKATASAATISKDCLIKDETNLFNMVDENGNFAPTIVKWADIKGKACDQVELMIDGGKLCKVVLITNGFESVQ